MDQSNGPTRNRKSLRSNVLFSATIELGGASLPVKLRNLSEQGALIAGKNLPVEGSEVMFKRNDFSTPGRIAWVSETQAGIAFSNPLSAQDVLRNVPQPKPRIHSGFRRPGLNVRSLTSQEQVAMDRWMALMGMRRS